MDPLTDLFHTIHVASVVHARLEATAPWGLMREAKDANEAVAHSSALRNLPSQFAHFGMVSRGNRWLSVKGIPDPLPLTGGGCFLLALFNSLCERRQRIGLAKSSSGCPGELPSSPRIAVRLH